MFNQSDSGNTHNFEENLRNKLEANENLASILVELDNEYSAIDNWKLLMPVCADLINQLFERAGKNENLIKKSINFCKKYLLPEYCAAYSDFLEFSNLLSNNLLPEVFLQLALSIAKKQTSQNLQIASYAIAINIAFTKFKTQKNILQKLMPLYKQMILPELSNSDSHCRFIYFLSKHLSPEVPTKIWHFYKEWITTISPNHSTPLKSKVIHFLQTNFFNKLPSTPVPEYQKYLMNIASIYYNLTLLMRTLPELRYDIENLLQEHKLNWKQLSHKKQHEILQILYDIFLLNKAKISDFMFCCREFTLEGLGTELMTIIREITQIFPHKHWLSKFTTPYVNIPFRAMIAKVDKRYWITEYILEDIKGCGFKFLAKLLFVKLWLAKNKRKIQFLWFPSHLSCETSDIITKLLNRCLTNPRVIELIQPKSKSQSITPEQMERYIQMHRLDGIINIFQERLNYHTTALYQDETSNPKQLVKVIKGLFDFQVTSPFFAEKHTKTCLTYCRQHKLLEVESLGNIMFANIIKAIFTKAKVTSRSLEMVIKFCETTNLFNKCKSLSVKNFRFVIYTIFYTTKPWMLNDNFLKMIELCQKADLLNKCSDQFQINDIYNVLVYIFEQCTLDNHNQTFEFIKPLLNRLQAISKTDRAKSSLALNQIFSLATAENIYAIIQLCSHENLLGKEFTENIDMLLGYKPNGSINYQKILMAIKTLILHGYRLDNFESFYPKLWLEKFSLKTYPLWVNLFIIKQSLLKYKKAFSKRVELVKLLSIKMEENVTTSLANILSNYLESIQENNESIRRLMNDFDNDVSALKQHLIAKGVNRVLQLCDLLSEKEQDINEGERVEYIHTHYNNNFTFHFRYNRITSNKVLLALNREIHRDPFNSLSFVSI